MRSLKGKFKDSSAGKQCFVLFYFCIFGLSMSSVLGSILLFVNFKTDSSSVLQEIMQNLMEYPEWMKIFQFLQTTGLFIFPAIACAYLFSDDYKRYLRMDIAFRPELLLWVSLSVIILIPFINSIYALNQYMIFPEWMKNRETLTDQSIQRMLYVSVPQDLIFNIILVCLFTAVGEECIFRGIVQNLLSRFVKNPHKVIWVAAVLFSTIHLQFSGFLPRLVLGAYFGYLLHYTNNLWISISAHGIYNLWGVIVAFLFQACPDMLEQADQIGTGSTWWLSVVSIVLFPLFLSKIKRLGASFINILY